MFEYKIISSEQSETASEESQINTKLDITSFGYDAISQEPPHPIHALTLDYGIIIGKPHMIDGSVSRLMLDNQDLIRTAYKDPISGIFKRTIIIDQPKISLLLFQLTDEASDPIFAFVATSTKNNGEFFAAGKVTVKWNDVPVSREGSRSIDLCASLFSEMKSSPKGVDYPANSGTIFTFKDDRISVLSKALPHEGSAADVVCTLKYPEGQKFGLRATNTQPLTLVL